MKKLNNDLMNSPYAAQICFQFSQLNAYYKKHNVFNELSNRTDSWLGLHIDNIVNTYPTNIIQDCIKIMYASELTKHNKVA